MLLPDHEIRKLCDPNRDEYCGEGIAFLPVFLSKPRPVMIEPFSEAVSGNGVISYGVSHAGYDLRLGPEIMVFKNTYNETINPKKFGDEEYRKRVFDECDYSKLYPFSLEVGLPPEEYRAVVIPPHGYILGRSWEYLRMPRHLKGRCVGKSTLARSGILVNCTPLEPGWNGHLVIEIGNITPCPATVYVGEGIAQLEFELLASPPETDYRQKQGKYQDQTGVTVAKVL